MIKPKNEQIAGPGGTDPASVAGFRLILAMSHLDDRPLDRYATFWTVTAAVLVACLLAALGATVLLHGAHTPPPVLLALWLTGLAVLLALDQASRFVRAAEKARLRAVV